MQNCDTVSFSKNESDENEDEGSDTTKSQNSFISRLPPPELNSTKSKPRIFCWHSNSWKEDIDLLDPCPSQDFLQEKINLDSNIITHEPTLPPDTWLLYGPLGSRNAVLVFKSSALAHTTELSIREKPAYKLHITYKVLQAETKLLSKLLDCHGVTEVAANSSDFNLLWTGSHLKPGLLRSLGPHQRVNHFPRSYELTRKDRLYKNIEKMQYAKGVKNFDFIPQTFVMPTEYRELCQVHNRIKGPWIVKPVASSRGRGIFIVETPNQVPLEEPVVVAKYISNPLLVAGHKCDLRLYVVVTSFDPLLVYIYEEGLVRFATVKYDPSPKQLWNPCMHLCNYSINKYHSDYVKSDDPSAENVGHKWTLSALLRHLKSEGKDTKYLMLQIEDLVIKAILASANSIVSACRMFVPNPSNCFELYGFDILIDDNFKPWLLEVNLSPSLGCDSPLDVRLKSAMMADLLTLVGIPAVDPILRSGSAGGASSRNGSYNRMKFPHVHSAEGLNNTLPRKRSSYSSQNSRLSGSNLTLSSEELRYVKMSKQQFDRRGGFVRIFPTMDTWSKYSQYLDPISGVPISGTHFQNVYALSNSSQNLNLVIFTQLFPEIPVIPKSSEKTQGRYSSLDRKKICHENTSKPKQGGSSQIARQDRYERMLTQGHRSALGPSRLKDSKCAELRKEIIGLLKDGKRMSQRETRKTFSHYLEWILHRISTDPNQEEHVEIVLKFLQKASNYLRSPFSIKIPSVKLGGKDRAAIIAKQFNDFIYLYNKETEYFVDKTEYPSQIPEKLYDKFLANARECDLEEVLIYQTTHTVPQGIKQGIQGLLKNIPNVPKQSSSKNEKIAPAQT
ncbi:tubulin polyglutamylase TTLL5 isoform X2 [Coccinella septempunctata]|uniref:tubulin polyglutamylase TTLL5 isoform X2 n=1 Tax=Coccinella septempunctata TaxID=41139 RepID=UPI001D087E31|nr:tubulin polyglutamylase TTLL5 isoform X2 [Coccinella septempunctata]